MKRLRSPDQLRPGVKVYLVDVRERYWLISTCFSSKAGLIIETRARLVDGNTADNCQRVWFHTDYEWMVEE